MLCIITRKSRASIWGKLHHCQTYLRHFSHRRNYTVCSSRDSFAYSESHHDSYPQFPRSSLGTHGLQTRSHRQKKETPAFLESRLLLKQARLIREMRGLASLGQAQPLAPLTSKFLRLLSSLTPLCSIQFKNKCVWGGMNKSFRGAPW